MASEYIRTGKSIYGGYYAEDRKGNIGRGKTESVARQALDAAQNQNNSKKK